MVSRLACCAGHSGMRWWGVVGGDTEQTHIFLQASHTGRNGALPLGRAVPVAGSQRCWIACWHFQWRPQFRRMTHAIQNQRGGSISAAPPSLSSNGHGAVTHASSCDGAPGWARHPVCASRPRTEPSV